MTAKGIWHNKSKIVEVAERYGTPFYCYDAMLLTETFQSLRTGLSKSVDIFYSIKANPNIALCDELRQLGTGVEVSSYGEILAAIKAGFSPKNIIFVGPAKSDQAIQQCLKRKVYAIVCESIKEFRRISTLAGNYGVDARVALRINPTHMVRSALLKMGGKPSQFGMDEEIVFANKDFFFKMPHIKLVGIHIYNGTRILNAEAIVENTAYILNIARTLQREWNQTFEMVDIGGGLGVPYFDSEQALDLALLKSLMDPIINAYLKDFGGTRIILESGRYLVATTGIFVSRVLDIKLSKGEQFVITDGGTNCHMAAVGLGSLVKRNFPMSVVCLNKNNEQTFSPYNVTGPLCTPGDMLGKQVLLPQLSRGDLVLIRNSGAYGPTASPVMFLSHCFPAEVLFKNNAFHLIRDRFTAHEFIDKQYLVN